jgi:hypothetical protein
MAEQGAIGVTLKITVTAVLTAVANLLDVAFPEQEKFLADSTSHGSADGYVEYISSGVRELKSFKATLGWDVSEPTHAAMVTAFASDSYLAMSIEDPSANEVISFNGHVQKIGRVTKIKDMYKCDVTIQPTGVPTIV